MNNFDEEKYDVLSVNNYDEVSNDYRMPPPNLGFPPPKFPNNNPGGSGFPPPPPPFIGPQFPSGGKNPGGNFPGGQNQGGQNLGAPPNYIPSKNDAGVKTLSSPGFGGPDGGGNLKSVSPNQINFCLYKYTYIWQNNGRSYWAYLTNVDRVSVSGLRWMGWSWAYFGIDLRKIDSFVCYRCDECSSSRDTRGNSSDILENIGKEYSLDDTREVYRRVLAYVDVLERKDDFIVESIGLVNDREIKSKYPCVKYRNTQYRLTLEANYPENLDKNIKDNILNSVKVAAEDAYDIIENVSLRSASTTPLEGFEECSKHLNNALNTFSNRLYSEFKNHSDNKDILRKVRFRVVKEKATDNWKIEH